MMDALLQIQLTYRGGRDLKVGRVYYNTSGYISPFPSQFGTPILITEFRGHGKEDDYDLFTYVII